MKALSPPSPICSTILLYPFNVKLLKSFIWLYETVEEVLKNEKGIIYFKSYTSDKNGVKVCSQNKFSEEHTTGREYVSQYWTKVNHINL